jgi:hypothetical protein
VLDLLGRAAAVGWDRAVVDSISIRAEKDDMQRDPSAQRTIEVR